MGITKLESKLSLFRPAFEAALREAISAHPEYTHRADKVAESVAKVTYAIHTGSVGSVNIDTPEWRGAAKTLGIRNTNAAWNAWLSE